MTTATGWTTNPPKVWRAVCPGCLEEAPEGTQLDVMAWSAQHRCTRTALTVKHQGAEK